MEKAFLETVNTNRAMIFKLCNMYCNDHESRKDLFQEVVLQLWKSYPGFRRASATSTWIYRVALNTAISNFRKESRKPPGVLLSLQEFQIPDLGESIAEKEKSLALHQVINQLTPIEKAIIMLYLEEKSYEEISEIMGISTSNVGVRLNRIKSKLSKLINNALT